MKDSSADLMGSRRLKLYLTPSAWLCDTTEPPSSETPPVELFTYTPKPKQMQILKFNHIQKNIVSYKITMGKLNKICKHTVVH